MTEKEKELDYRQVMERLGISKTTVYALIQAGTLRAYNSGFKKRIRVRESDLERFRQEREA